MNYAFTLIFIIEAGLKIIAYGDTYFGSDWNKFDFFVVVSSIFEIIMGRIDAKGANFLKVGAQLARVMRVLRVSRLFKLIN